VVRRRTAFNALPNSEPVTPKNSFGGHGRSAMVSLGSSTFSLGLSA
jgi:hypothetical protein